MTKDNKQILIFRPFKGLSTVQSAILSLVVSFTKDRRGSKQFRMTNATIGEMLGVKPETAKAAIRVLRKKGYVENYMRHSRGRTVNANFKAFDVPEEDYCVIDLPIKHDLKLSLVLATINQYDKDYDGNRGRIPKLKLILKKTGLSDKTARKHLKRILGDRKAIEDAKREAEFDKPIWEEIVQTELSDYKKELCELNSDNIFFNLGHGSDPDRYVKDQMGNIVYKGDEDTKNEEMLLKHNTQFEKEYVTLEDGCSVLAIRAIDPVQHKIEPLVLPKLEQEVNFEPVPNGYVYEGVENSAHPYVGINEG